MDDPQQELQSTVFRDCFNNCTTVTIQLYQGLKADLSPIFFPLVTPSIMERCWVITSGDENGSGPHYKSPTHI